MTTTRAIGYIRVSTDEQAERGVSLDAQRAKIEAWCLAMDIELVRVEIDAGLSAKTLNRPALQRALGALKRGEADALLVVKLDRLSRSVRDTLALVETHFRGERSLISLSESIDTRTAAGRMIVTVLSALAQLEREQIGERTATALAHLASQGKRVSGQIPYGYQLADDGETLVEHAHEQATIAQARTLRSSGLSLRATAETLAERGLLARTGRPFAPSAIASMVEVA
jgi:DNA invertase Pin-like site-specific DNA recombinase